MFTKSPEVWIKDTQQAYDIPYATCLDKSIDSCKVGSSWLRVDTVIEASDLLDLTKTPRTIA
jgi:hypothetical protein